MFFKKKDISKNLYSQILHTLMPYRVNGIDLEKYKIVISKEQADEADFKHYRFDEHFHCTEIEYFKRIDGVDLEIGSKIGIMLLLK